MMMARRVVTYLDRSKLRCRTPFWSILSIHWWQFLWLCGQFYLGNGTNFWENIQLQLQLTLLTWTSHIHILLMTTISRRSLTLVIPFCFLSTKKGIQRGKSSLYLLRLDELRKGNLRIISSFPITGQVQFKSIRLFALTRRLTLQFIFLVILLLEWYCKWWTMLLLLLIPCLILWNCCRGVSHAQEIFFSMSLITIFFQWYVRRNLYSISYSGIHSPP